MMSGLKRLLSKRKKMRKFDQELSAFLESEGKTNARFAVSPDDLQPCLDDNTQYTEFDRHYIFHVAWAVRVVKEINPALHTDFSSSLHFCTTLSAFIPTKFYDFRPAQLALSGLDSLPGDLTKINLPNNSIASLSCMHTVEHVGLGRYGDPIDYDGDLKAIAELKRVTKEGGSLLFVTPVGKARIRYNAHRIYSYDQIISYFEGFELKEFSLVPDRAEDGGLVRNASKELSDMQNYGCGCFWFIKKS